MEPKLFIMLANATVSDARFDYLHTQLATIWAGRDPEFGAQMVFPPRGGPQDWPDQDIVNRANNQAQVYPVRTFKKVVSVNYEPWGGNPDPELVADVMKKMIAASAAALSDLDNGNPGGTPGATTVEPRPLVLYSLPHVTIHGLIIHDHYDVPQAAQLTAMAPSVYMRTTVHPQPRDLSLAKTLADQLGKPLWPFVSPQRDGDGDALPEEDIRAMLEECVESEAGAVINWINAGLSDQVILTSQQRMADVWTSMFGEPPPPRQPRKILPVEPRVRSFTRSGVKRVFDRR